MPKTEILFDSSFQMSIDSKMLEEIRMKAKSQKVSLAQIARNMFEKCIEKEDEIEKNMYKDIKDIKDAQKLQIDFQDFMKEWIESWDKRTNSTSKETI